jgi:phosphate-selective porin OprO/OprP
LQQLHSSLLNSKFTLDRDIGVQLRHHFNLTDTLVKEIFSIAQGEGRNITTGIIGGHQYTTRIKLFPFGNFTSKGDDKGSDLKFEPNPKLSLGFAYDFNHKASKTASNQGSYMLHDTGFYSTNISPLFMDALLKRQGFSFMAAYAK